MAKLHTIKNEELLINKMYVGEYLENDCTHIGHEVINLLKTDNGENYIYINPYGSMSSEHNNKIDTILLVRNTGISETLEVLGQAWNLKQLAYIENSYPKDKERIYSAQIEDIKNSEIKYCDKYLNEIFGTGEDNKNIIYYTFRAGEVRRPKNGTRIFITYRTGEEKTELENLLKKDSNNKIIYINDRQDNEQINISKSSLKMYVSCKKNQNVFNVLKEILESEKYWEEENTTQKSYNIIISEYSDHNFIDIIDKHKAEITYSNLFQYIFESNKLLCSEFINNVLLKKVEPKLTVSKNLRIKREEGHIDLLIYDDTNKNIIVIENKIKSGINGISYDLNGDIIQSQLKNYYYYVNGKNKNGVVNEDLDKKFSQFPNKFFFIFAPDYNKKINGKEVKVKINDKDDITYKIINYSEIFEFFNEQPIVNRNIPYYYEFLYALEKHTEDTDNLLEKEMYIRFKNSIN